MRPNHFPRTVPGNYAYWKLSALRLWKDLVTLSREKKEDELTSAVEPSSLRSVAYRRD